MWLQGERLHLVVRLFPTADDRAELDAVLARWRELSIPKHRDLVHRYAGWLFEPGPGVWPDDPGVIPLPAEGSLDQVRVAITEITGAQI